MRSSLLPLATCLLVGCAATKIENTWTASQPPPEKIQKFAVFAVTGSPSGRVAYEETLTTRLKDAGLPAIPGYDLVTYDEHPSKDELMRRLQEKGIDAALVSRVDRKTTKTESTPVWVGGGYAPGFYDYYYTPVAMSTYTTETNEFVVETVLYSLKDNKPYWAARSNTSRTAPTKFANDIAKPVADSLKESGLFAPAAR
jgi:hypothetical protein